MPLPRRSLLPEGEGTPNPYDSHVRGRPGETLDHCVPGIRTPLFVFVIWCYVTPVHGRTRVSLCVGSLWVYSCTLRMDGRKCRCGWDPSVYPSSVTVVHFCSDIPPLYPKLYLFQVLSSKETTDGRDTGTTKSLEPVLQSPEVGVTRDDKVVPHFPKHESVPAFSRGPT